MGSTNDFVPKLVSLFREGYHLADLKKDLISGLMLGIIAIPLSIAFAIASGARPEQGIMTAIIAGFIASSTSGSRYQISGPTGAFVILVGTTISKYGYEGLLIATFLAGIILVISGISRVGTIIKFIPYSVTVGFTGGIALLIAFSQIPDFLGIAISTDSFTFIDKILETAPHLKEINPACALIGMFSITIMALWPKLRTPLSGSLVVIVAATVMVQLFSLPCETIGDRFGSLEFTIPSISLPSLDLQMMPELVQAAIAIAFLVGIESLLSAVVADGMTGRRHRSHMELISQGLANIASSLCGGLPATGAIARTAANIQSGAVSPISGMTYSVAIVILMLFMGTYIALIPLSAVAGILLMIAYRMGEWHHFLTIFRCPIGDIAILLTTFVLTVFVDLLTAIQAGIILATFISINRMAEGSGMRNLREAIVQEEMPEDVEIAQAINNEDKLEVYEVYGSLFFAAMEKFMIILTRSERKPEILILRMRHVMSIDASGVKLLFDLLDKTKKNKTLLLVSGIPESRSVYQSLEKSGFIASCGKEHLFSNSRQALEYARAMLRESIVEKQLQVENAV